jgi:hypothetical protein
MLLFANDQITVSNTEDKPQETAYKLNKITIEHGSAV